MKMQWNVMAGAVALLLAAGAQAQILPGAYAQIGGGMSHYNEDCSGFSSCDKSGSAAKIVAGYRFFPFLSIEGVGINFGKETASSPSGSIEIKTQGFGAGVALTGEFSGWRGVARLGVLSMKTKADSTIQVATGISQSVNDSKTTAQAYAGFGIGYVFAPFIYAEAGIDSSRAEIAGGKTNVAAYTLSVGVRF